METQSNQGKYEFNVIYNKDNELGYLNADIFDVYCEFYFIGDLKFLFVMIGRSVILGGRCIFYKLKQY